MTRTEVTTCAPTVDRSESSLGQPLTRAATLSPSVKRAAARVPDSSRRRDDLRSSAIGDITDGASS
jgi:hypothetical protein